MSKTKLVPKLQSAWSPIVKTKPLTQEEIEIQNTLQNLYKNTEDLRNGDYDRQQMQIKQEQAKKDKRRQAFSNAMLTIAMGENAPIAIASGYGYDENGNIGQYYVDNPGVKALRNNLAVLGATGTAAMTPQAVTVLSQTVSEGIAPILTTVKAATNRAKPVLTLAKKYKKPIKRAVFISPFISTGYNLGRMEIEDRLNKKAYQQSIDKYLQMYELNETQQNILSQIDRIDQKLIKLNQWEINNELNKRQYE